MNLHYLYKSEDDIHTDEPWTCCRSLDDAIDEARKASVLTFNHDILVADEFDRVVYIAKV